MKTTQGAICGGFTSKNWDGSNKFIDDIDAFVFNMTHKYNPNNSEKAIDTQLNGFRFGNGILLVTSSTSLNEKNEGRCRTGKHNFYDIEGDVSPLTNQKDSFTCEQLEVYKVLYW